LLEKAGVHKEKGAEGEFILYFENIKITTGLEKGKEKSDNAIP
jgi:hypothetical protein